MSRAARVKATTPPPPIRHSLFADSPTLRPIGLHRYYGQCNPGQGVSACCLACAYGRRLGSTDQTKSSSWSLGQIPKHCCSLASVIRGYGSRVLHALNATGTPIGIGENAVVPRAATATAKPPRPRNTAGPSIRSGCWQSASTQIDRGTACPTRASRPVRHSGWGW